MASSRINIDEPRYDQSTFIGRAKHFFITTNPLNLFTTPQQLEEAKNIVEKHRFVSFSYSLAANCDGSMTKHKMDRTSKRQNRYDARSKITLKNAEKYIENIKFFQIFFN